MAIGTDCGLGHHHGRGHRMQCSAARGGKWNNQAADLIETLLAVSGSAGRGIRVSGAIVDLPDPARGRVHVEPVPVCGVVYMPGVLL